MRNKKTGDRPRPEQKAAQIELSEKHLKWRVLLFVLSLLIAITAFGYGIYSWLAAETGWQEIQALDTDSVSCSGDFTFYYNIGAGETSATAEYKALRSLYSEAAAEAYQLFSSDMESEDLANLWYLNQHVNEEIQVENALYEALLLLEESGNRYHYLAPMYEMYVSLCNCSSDDSTSDYDPWKNEDLRVFYEETVLFTSDPDSISLTLLGNNTVMLSVSDSYLEFAQENSIETLIDLGWMKNAFLIDYLADCLTANGYLSGTLISDDGFIRNLDTDSGSEYALTLTHREGSEISDLATLYFSGAVSLIILHDYPLGDGDADNYYVYSDGTIRSLYVDPTDGLCRSALPELAGSSEALTCAELALTLAPVFICESFDASATEALAEDGITIYYCKDGALVTNADS